jgi:hypothetical protein
MAQAQMRMYTIEPGRLDEFVKAWSARVRPLRRDFGFESAAWTVPEEDLFVWLLTFRGKGTFEDADAEYYASPRRQAITPDPADLIARKETRWLTPLSGGAPPSARSDSAPSDR